MLKIVFLWLVALMAGISAEDAPVFNGMPVEIEQVPHLVQLRNRRNGVFICIGALVTPRHVVTSATCFEGHNPAVEYAVVGNIKSFDRDDGIRHLVDDYDVHPGHRRGLEYDVAVLRLEKPMNYPNTVPVKLCSKDVPVGAKMEYVGYEYYNSRYVRDLLNRKIVTVDSFDVCKKEYNFLEVPEQAMCATQSGLTDTCNYNTGAPALQDGELCGIVSWVLKCDQKEKPILFTEINKVKDFILECLKL